MHVLFNSTCTDGRRFVVFFVGAALRHNNMVDCHVFFVEPPSTCQFESFKDAEWRVEGGECVSRHPNRRPRKGVAAAFSACVEIIKKINHSMLK